MNSRADRGSYASWWWTIDRVALVLMLMLITIGLVLAFAASPAATGGPLTAGDFRYTAKQILFAVIAAAILGGASLLSLQQLKITAAIVFAVALIGSGLVLVAGNEVLGARPLDRARPVLAPAVGIPQARLRGAGRRDHRRPQPDEAAQAGHHLPADRPRPRHPADAARCRADHAAAGAVGGAAVLLRRAAQGHGDPGRRHRRAGRAGLYGLPACPSPHRPVPQSDRYGLSDRLGAEGFRPWRTDGRRPRRWHDQVPHPRGPFRFRLRGRGRGVRP
ncbi:MAG: hypothetical protein WDM81_12685 [Rhizomicrobium sp.]